MSLATLFCRRPAVLPFLRHRGPAHFSFIIPLESYGWQVRQAVKESFQLWQNEIANLDFEECPSCEENGDKEADIKIYFNK